eukprot:GHVQ01012262.1.p1 GENE.GHVQ01012262.1~~GHVQ01012262.1.p1  ORF type:complete len:605 (-),score=86.90 GHVQ01012262.1:2709-4523(-)
MRFVRMDCRSNCSRSTSRLWFGTGRLLNIVCLWTVIVEFMAFWWTVKEFLRCSHVNLSRSDAVDVLICCGGYSSSSSSQRDHPVNHLSRLWLSNQTYHGGFYGNHNSNSFKQLLTAVQAVDVEKKVDSSLSVSDGIKDRNNSEMSNVVFRGSGQDLFDCTVDRVVVLMGLHGLLQTRVSCRYSVMLRNIAEDEGQCDAHPAYNQDFDNTSSHSTFERERRCSREYSNRQQQMTNQKVMVDEEGSNGSNEEVCMLSIEDHLPSALFVDPDELRTLPHQNPQIPWMSVKRRKDDNRQNVGNHSIDNNSVNRGICYNSVLLNGDFIDIEKPAFAASPITVRQMIPLAVRGRGESKWLMMDVDSTTTRKDNLVTFFCDVPFHARYALPCEGPDCFRFHKVKIPFPHIKHSCISSSTSLKSVSEKILVWQRIPLSVERYSSLRVDNRGLYDQEEQPVSVADNMEEAGNVNISSSSSGNASPIFLLGDNGDKRREIEFYVPRGRYNDLSIVLFVLCLFGGGCVVVTFVLCWIVIHGSLCESVSAVESSEPTKKITSSSSNCLTEGRRKQPQQGGTDRTKKSKLDCDADCVTGAGCTVLRDRTRGRCSRKL